MPWIDKTKSLSTKQTVVIDRQDALHMSAYQPFLTFSDSNAGDAQARIQGPDGKLVFYTQSALTVGDPTVIFNSLKSAGGSPLPSAIEIHAQDGVDTVGYQPFLTLTDANAGYAKSRIQGVDGKLAFYTQSGLASGGPTVVFNSIAAADGPLPSAIEIHAQDGVVTVGYQPFLTLMDANAGYAKARIQNANGDLILYSQGAMGRPMPDVIIESASGDVHVTGALKVDRDIILTGADCAERFELAEAEALDPGTVVVIDESGKLRTSDRAYDRRVAGVIAGAGDFRPAIIMGSGEADGAGGLVALVGRTFCKVDASGGAIEVGDLLTPSSTPGHAMKASEPTRAFGAVLGKALRPLPSGTGLIPILVALQ